jgi:signal transduction histidine kinase
MSVDCPTAPNWPAPYHHHPSTPSMLGLDSTLGDLSLYLFQVDAQCCVQSILHTFECYPQLPGVVLLQSPEGEPLMGDRLLGMISRQTLLEGVFRSQGFELLLTKPMHGLYSSIRRPTLMLSVQTLIVQAARSAMRRSPDCWGEPLLVQTQEQDYYLLDVHELNRAYWQIRGIETQVRYEQAQVQMIQIEKMASLGRLVDGVAHEILDPVGFIWGNLTHVSQYVDQLLGLNAAYEATVDPVPETIQALKRDGELEYLTQDLPKAIASIQTGAERLKKLALSLQNFCHIDELYPKAADLHECLNAVVLLLKSRLSREIEVEKCYGHLPPVSCYAGQLSQVFMNILIHCVEALLNRAVYLQEAETLTGHLPDLAPPPKITITTAVQTADGAVDPVGDRWVSIRITNNGAGLTPPQQQQLFESFSTHQYSIKETTLGLSYRIVTAKHGGKLTLRSPCFEMPAEPPNALHSTASYGTEFEILLPLS